MKMEITKELVKGSAVLAGGTGIFTGVMSFFQQNAAGIGAIGTIVFGIVYVFFQIRLDKKVALAEDNRKVLNEVITTLNQHDAKLGRMAEGIESIQKSLEKD